MIEWAPVITRSGRRAERGPDLDLGGNAVDDLRRELRRGGVAAEVGRLAPGPDRLEPGFVDSPRGALGGRPVVVGRVSQQSATGEDHRQRVRQIFALER